MSQDPVKVAPHAYKTLLENDRVRVLDVRLKGGEKTVMHWHPANTVYALSAAKVKFTFPDGKSQEVEIKPGEPIWQEGGSHAAENMGTNELHAVIVELKK